MTIDRSVNEAPSIAPPRPTGHGPGLPFRGPWPPDEPAARPALALPPRRMPMLRHGRPLKRWRWVGLFCEPALICVGQAWVGPVRQSFWAVWDRERRSLSERTTVLGAGGVSVRAGFAGVQAPGVELALVLDEGAGVETVCPCPRGGYVWTRKQGGVPARVTLALGDGPPRRLSGLAVIDDTAGYHDRHTEWWWAAGVGRSRAGSVVAWNLVSGVNDPPEHSERTVWIDSIPHEIGPVRFAPDLSAIDFDVRRGESGALRFTAEAERRRHEELLLVASYYRQPFGTFSGSLPGMGELHDGLGVTEHHRARW